MPCRRRTTEATPRSLVEGLATTARAIASRSAACDVSDASSCSVWGSSLTVRPPTSEGRIDRSDGSILTDGEALTLPDAGGEPTDEVAATSGAPVSGGGNEPASPVARMGGVGDGRGGWLIPSTDPTNSPRTTRAPATMNG